MTLWIGLDFGTSNSCAAVMRGPAAEIIELPDGLKQLPSAVAIVDGAILVGHEALEKGRANRQFLYRHFKRRLGEQYREESDSGFQTFGDEDGTVAWRGPVNAAGEKTKYSTIELASYVMAELLDAAEAKLGERPTGAVITIPADSGEAQRAATIAAAKMAGLEQVELMHEPTAAALAYGFDFAQRRVIAVVDLGGGTLDVSIIETGKGRKSHSLVEVLATDGRRKGLGGIDFDRMLTQYLVNRWRTQYPDYDIAGDAIIMDRITEAAEAAKIKLSSRDEARVHVRDIVVTKEGVSLSMDELIRLADMEEICKQLTDSIAAICRRAVDKAKEKDANFSVMDIHDVVLVGAMTRSPIVRAAIKSVFGREPKKDISPEDAVALGAAIQAARLSGRKTGLTVRDITSQPIAVETVNDVAAIIFASGTPIPAEKTVTLRNASDGQEALSLALLEGAALRASECTVLARHDHIVAEPGPAKSAGLKLTVKIDESGRLSAETEDGWTFEAAA